MHIVDGALTAPVLIAGAALAVGGVAIGLKKIDLDQIPQAGLLSAVFFVASLVHVPIGPSSVHLILNGLIGLALGWVAFPALLIALLLQAVFFGFGGFVVLGVNTFNIAFPALLMFLICRGPIRRSTPTGAAIWGAVAGAGAIVLTTVLVALSLAAVGEGFWVPAQLAIVSHLPVMVLEAIITAATVYLICKVKPEFFDAGHGSGSISKESV